MTPNARARVSPSAEIQRRTFLGGVASLLVTASVAAEPHRGERPLRIGYLSPTVSTPLEAGWLQEWRIALSRRGYPEHVVTLEERYAGDRLERLPTLATELVRVRADLLLTFATQATLAAKAATAAIPIVMIGVGDPIGVGIVRSLNRPESNITGLALSNVDTAGKRLEFLKQAVPGLSRVAVLTNPRNEALTNLHMAQTQQVADRLGIALDRQAVTGPEHLAATFAAVVRQGVNGVLVLPDPVFIAHRERIAQLALNYRLPAAAPEGPFVEAGCLLAYGPDVAEIYRQAARFVDRILRGAKPADLPVEQPTEFELVINLKTAKALRLRIPQGLLLRAHHVIG